jgi:hypothetical protein
LLREDAPAGRSDAAPEAREAVLADRLEQPQRGGGGDGLDACSLPRPVPKAPPAAGPLELRRLAVVAQDRVQLLDRLLLRRGVEAAAKPLAQLARRRHVGLAHGGRQAVEVQVAPEPALAQELRRVVELVPRVEQVDRESDAAAAS